MDLCELLVRRQHSFRTILIFYVNFKHFCMNMKLMKYEFAIGMMWVIIIYEEV